MIHPSHGASVFGQSLSLGAWIERTLPVSGVGRAGTPALLSPGERFRGLSPLRQIGRLGLGLTPN